MTGDPIPYSSAKRMSSEQFEAWLLSVRDGANATLSEWALEAVTGGDEHEAKLDDARSVWHAAEVALAMVKKGYVPKYEAMLEIRALLDSWEEE